jgi:hypothetical protein
MTCTWEPCKNLPDTPAHADSGCLRHDSSKQRVTDACMAKYNKMKEELKESSLSKQQCYKAESSHFSMNKYTSKSNSDSDQGDVHVGLTHMARTGTKVRAIPADHLPMMGTLTHMIRPLWRVARSNKLILTQTKKKTCHCWMMM